MMSECFNPFPIALGLTLRSPIAKPLNTKIELLKEAGLIEKWQKEGRDLAGKVVEKRINIKATRFVQIL